MRKFLFLILSLCILVSLPSDGQTAKGNASAFVNVPIPKGAVHLVATSDAQARQIFTYFPYPPTPQWGRRSPFGVLPPTLPITGLYRLEVTPEGAVSAITILKSMGPAIDATAMKTFIHWRAKPGPLRVVDVGWKIGLRGRL